MRLLNFDANWFCSTQGQTAYSSLRTLEDRSVFLYSYLKKITKADFEKDQLLFRLSFFLADAVAGSELPYSAYPALVDPAKNPFVAYLKNTTLCPGSRAVYCICLAILHGIADPFVQNNWIYQKELQDADYLEEKLSELDKNFVATSVSLADPDAFAIDAPLRIVQLKLIWLLGQLK